MDAAFLASVVIAFLSGAMLTCQIGMNAQIRIVSGSPMWAAIASFAVGLVALIAVTAGMRQPLPTTQSLAAAPWWAWSAGLLGAFYVAASAQLAAKLGATSLTALVVGGQIIASLVVDHFNWLGFSDHPVSLPRLLGAGLLMVGVVLVVKY